MKYFSELLFDGQKWLKDVSFEVDSNGVISSFIDNAKKEGLNLGVVIPGFVNCHSHSFQRAMAAKSEQVQDFSNNDSFWTWRETMYDLVEKLDGASFEKVADFAYMDMLEAGFTSVGEFHYLHKDKNSTLLLGESVLDSASKVGIRIALFPVLYQQGGIDKQLGPKQERFYLSTDEMIQYCKELSLKVKPGNHLGVSIHSLRAVNKENMDKLIDFQKSIDCVIHIHISEQPAEVEQVKTSYGKPPVEYLFENYSVDDKWCLVHATHVNEKEVSLMAESGCTVGICPITEANLGDGIFPLTSYLKQGGSFAIGSDSHVRVDPLEELRLLEYSQRYRDLKRNRIAHEDQKGLVGETLISQTNKGGAKALGLPVGALKEGYYADFIVLNSEVPCIRLKNESSLINEIIFNASPRLIDDVYVSGVKKVSSGRHIKKKAIEDSYVAVIKDLE
ncbi:MAG: formimidoylglutamate deiminase [Candidatus Cloacimonetes bacterium]|nr:formimidoylglutamate deiminase [Candidatus Cloacimonadota bacterium]